MHISVGWRAARAGGKGRRSRKSEPQAAIKGSHGQWDRLTVFGEERGGHKPGAQSPVRGSLGPAHEKRSEIGTLAEGG